MSFKNWTLPKCNFHFHGIASYSILEARWRRSRRRRRKELCDAEYKVDFHCSTRRQWAWKWDFPPFLNLGPFYYYWKIKGKSIFCAKKKKNLICSPSIFPKRNRIFYNGMQKWQQWPLWSMLQIGACSHMREDTAWLLSHLLKVAICLLSRLSLLKHGY